MADMMQFDLVSPERRLASLTVSSVQLPGSDGDMTAMPNHAPTITTLRPGIVRAEGPDGTQEFAIIGGFAEVSAKGTSILAERALPVSEVTQEVIDSFVTDIAASSQSETAQSLDDLAKKAVDVAAMANTLGLSANS